MNKIVLKIDGMHCDKCAERLEKDLNNKEEIKKAKVSFKKKEAIITHNDLSLDKLKEYIEESGFEIAK